MQGAKGKDAGKGKEDVEKEDWYHGIISRREAEEQLKESGSWLCRATVLQNGQSKFVLSVRTDHSNVRHFVVNFDPTRGWTFEDRCFSSPKLLIEHHWKKKEPVMRMAVLGEPVHKPKRRWEVPSKDVRLINKIGEGNFGEVWSGELTYAGNPIPVAVKTLKSGAGGMTAVQREEFMKEAKTMLLYRHENLVRIYAVALDQLPPKLIMENCPGGGLDSHLKKHKGFTEPREKTRYCYEAACGMEYLAEKKNCVHRDLAARNCLLGVNDIVKIADFGLTRQGTYQMSDTHKTVPIRWTAPEALREGTFTKKTDIWSFGILIWEIFSDGTEPWPGKSVKEAYRAMLKGEQMEKPYSMDSDFDKIMRDCWNMDPEARPGMKELKDKIKHHKETKYSEHSETPLHH